jgi:hypothetical protein
VLTPEGSTLKTDMCKWVFGNYGLKKNQSGHIWTTLYIDDGSFIGEPERVK